MSFFASLLRPTGDEVYRLAMREMDPARVGEFEPICRGAVAGVLALIFIGMLWLVSLPGRLVTRLLRR